MLSYAIKVRDSVFVWGSNDIKTSLDWPLLIALQNDIAGDPLSISSHALADTSLHGTLHPGQCWTLPLLGLTGVSANCPTDTTVVCTLLIPNLRPPA